MLRSSEVLTVRDLNLAAVVQLKRAVGDVHHPHSGEGSDGFDD
jgi:hypothetical protein